MKYRLFAIPVLAAIAASAQTPQLDESRTKHYLELLMKTKRANTALQAFIATEQANCASKKLELKITPEGILTCLAAPPPAAPPAPPAKPSPEEKK